MHHPRTQVRIVEVGPRDGLQNINDHIPTTTKLELICRLEKAGLQAIELTSIVSSRAIPQLADCREVLQNPAIKQLINNPHLRLPVLVPNDKGLQIALQHGVKEVAVFVSATEGFSRANINCTVQDGINRAKDISSRATNAGVAVRGYVSCIFADPFDGPTSPSAVLHCVRELIDAGCYEVSLGDTLGVGSPFSVRGLIAYLVSHDIPVERLAGHFHDTYGQGVANVWEAYQCGIRTFDSSVSGLGGCPFAPGAKGNVASEDLVYMFKNAGIEAGINLIALAEVGAWISREIQKENASRAGEALLASRKLAAASSKPPVKISTDIHTPEWNLISEPDGLQIYRSGVNLKIVLNRPKNGNALTIEMISELTAVIVSTRMDQSISRIVITGNGKFFCTGMDLAKGSTPVGQGGSASDAQFERLTNLFEAIDQSPKVTIACLNGAAFGGGVGLAFACDIRLCTKATTVTLSEAKLGLCAATISKYIIREWGATFAREAMLTARPVTAAELKALAVVSGVYEDQSQLKKQLDNLLQQLKAVSPKASLMSKELVRLGWTDGGKEKQSTGIQALFDSMMQPGSDGFHGVKEFQAGRKVDWDVYMLQQQKAKL